MQKKLKNGRFELNAVIKVKANKEGLGTPIHGKGTSLCTKPEYNVGTQIFEAKSYTDYKIICNELSFSCHRVFLAIASPVFKTMIESKMKEAKESTLVLEDCYEDLIDNFLRFIYTGKMDEEALKENCVGFLELGEKYDMEGLKITAEQTMIATLDTENMLTFFQAGNLYRGENIRSAAKKFIGYNRRSLVVQEGWKDVLKGQTDLLLELLEQFSLD